MTYQPQLNHQLPLGNMATTPPAPTIAPAIIDSVNELNHPKGFLAERLAAVRQLVFGDRARLYTKTINGKECVLLLLGEVHYKLKEKAQREQRLLGMFDKIGLETQYKALDLKDMKLTFIPSTGLSGTAVKFLKFIQSSNLLNNSAMFSAQRRAVEGDIIKKVAECISHRPEGTGLRDLKVKIGQSCVTIEKLKTCYVKANGNYYDGKEILKAACKLLKGEKRECVESLQNLFPLERHNYERLLLYSFAGIFSPVILAHGVEMAKSAQLEKYDLSTLSPEQIHLLSETFSELTQVQGLLIGATFLPIAAAMLGRIMPDVLESLSDRWGYGLLCNNRSNHFFYNIDEEANGKPTRLAGVYGIGHMKQVEEKVLRAGWTKVIPEIS